MPIVHPLASAPVPSDPALAESRRQDAERARAMCVALYDGLNELLPSGRLKSIVLTTIEECCMWAVKAALHR